MKVRILYLYYDLMNLYGESGNIRVLERYLLDMGFDVEIEKKSIIDDLSFEGYDFIYCGSGMERDQKAALNHLCKYKQDIEHVIEKDTVLLFTGNSFEMLGEKIVALDGTVYNGLNIASFTVEERNVRYSKDVIYQFNEIDTPIIGYINKCTQINNVESPLFMVKMGLGNSSIDLKSEGYRYKNLFGTHVIGPIFSRNPKFTKHIINLILSSKIVESDDYKNIEYSYQNKAYDVTLKQLLARNINE